MRSGTTTVVIRFFASLGLATALGASCVSMDPESDLPPPDVPYQPPAVTRPADHVITLETTAYCPCQKCCGWRYNWFGDPVIASGPNSGKPKAVGVTASGLRARRGTLAADTRLFPMGTVMHIPGYGWGRVEDRGSAIQGRKIDLFMPTHDEALRWGRRSVPVRVWMAKRPPIPSSSPQKARFR